VEDFVGRYQLKQSARFFPLPVGSLEEYYPNYADWRKTSAQVSAMRGKHKIKLAKKVGKQITLDQLKAEMPVVVNALDKVWSLAFV
jgi:hypothetical protein